MLAGPKESTTSLARDWLLIISISELICSWRLMLMTGLRLIEGVGRARFQSQTGHELEDVIDKDGLERMTGGGFVEMDEAGLRATPAGLLCLNEVLRHLLAP